MHLQGSRALNTDPLLFGLNHTGSNYYVRVGILVCVFAAGVTLGFYLGDRQKPELKREQDLQRQLDVDHKQHVLLLDSHKTIVDSLNRSLAYQFKSGYIEGEIAQNQFIFSLIDQMDMIDRSNRMKTLTNDAMKFPIWSR